MKVRKLNIVREIDERDFPHWKRNGYKEYDEPMFKSDPDMQDIFNETPEDSKKKK